MEDPRGGVRYIIPGKGYYLMSNKNFLDLPYSQRQLIIVQPDEMVAAAEKMKQGGGEIDWKKLVSLIKPSPFFPNYMGAIVELAISAYQALAKAQESGLNVVPVGQTQAAKLSFPPGHPREQTLYVAHPALPNVYYTMATFHRMAFEHKFSEAILLLMSLGASKIRVEHVKGWSREFSAKVAGAIPQADLKANIEKNTSNASALLFEATLKKAAQPAIPDSLVWYPHEPTWQTIARGRMEHGLDQFSLTVNYEDDFSINAGAKLKVQKAGLELGGTFEDHTATTWKISGEFSPTHAKK
jgi:hypothetical protein